MLEETKNRREALVELAHDNNVRSSTAQIRDLYDAIENALNAGVSRTVIHQRLVDTGLEISLRHFDQALYRIRKGLKKSGQVKHTAHGRSERPVASKPALLESEKIPPAANFRERAKQFRDEVENTNWAEVIAESQSASKS